MVITFISDTALVRRLARNVVTQDFTDNQIINEQTAAYARIGTKTGKFDWTSLDPRFAFVQKIEEQLAAKYVLEHYGAGTPEEINCIQYWDAQVNEGLQVIVDEGVDAEEDANVLTATSRYESYASNLQDDQFATPYRSTNVIL
jgi:hypothetical protein